MSFYKFTITQYWFLLVWLGLFEKKLKFNFFFFFFYKLKMIRARDCYDEALMGASQMNQIETRSKSRAVQRLQRWYRNTLKPLIEKWGDADYIYRAYSPQKVIQYVTGDTTGLRVYFDEYGNQTRVVIERANPEDIFLDWDEEDVSEYQSVYCWDGDCDKIYIGNKAPSENRR